MNRNLLIAIAAVIVILGGYYIFKPKPVMPPVAETTTAPAADATATAPAADATATAPAATTAPAADATATAPATDSMAATPAMGDMAALLTPATWDAAKINTMIDASTLDAATKTTLKGLVDAAGTDAAKRTEAIAAIKTAMKL